MGCLCSRRKKNSSGGKIDELNILLIENQKVNVFELKRKLKSMKQDIRAIRICNCESDRDRFESVDILLLREDLQIGDFPHLKSVVIDFKKKEGRTEMKNDILDQQLYEKALQTIEKDVKIHLQLKYSVDNEQMSINQLAFRDKRAFLYIMRKMKQLNSSLKKIIFQDIITLKKNIFFTLFQQIREITHLQEIHIINTNISELQAIHLQQLLCWMQNQIKVLNITGANLIDNHIDILFFQKLNISDLKRIDRLELKNCPQLWKSSKYIQLMMQYAKIKAEQQSKLNKYSEDGISNQKNTKASTKNPQNVKNLRLPSQQSNLSPIPSNLKVLSPFKNPSKLLSLSSAHSFSYVPQQRSDWQLSRISENTKIFEMIEEDQYDNRHSRHLLIGQSLFELERQFNLERSRDPDKVQEIQNQGVQQNTQNQKNNTSAVMLKKEDVNSNEGINNSNDNQFFSQFLKSCFRELMDIDMCQVIDFSKFSYQNLSIDQKKQMSNYILHSNSIQLFIIQYDRLFFKELTEGIAMKFRQRVQEYLKKQTKQLNKKDEQNGTNEIEQENSMDNSFSWQLKQNMISLESIKVIASSYESFQFDFFCFISFLSLFLLSIEVDFQYSQLENQIVFPSHQQIIDYIKKMIKSQDYEESSEEEDGQDFFSKEENNEENYLTDFSQIKTETINAPDEQNNFLGQEQQKYFSESSQKKDESKKGKAKQTSESATIFDNIQYFKLINDLQTTVQDLTLKNFRWQNIQYGNQEKSFSQFLFSYFSFTSNSLMNLEFYDVILSHSCLIRLQEVLKRVFVLYNLEKKREQDYKEEIIQATTVAAAGTNQKEREKIFGTSQSIKIHQTQQNKKIRRAKTSNLQKKENKKRNKSIMELNRNSMKNKFFLSKFKIVLLQQKMMPINSILNIFSTMCREVEIINASNTQIINQQSLPVHLSYFDQTKPVGTQEASLLNSNLKNTVGQKGSLFQNNLNKRRNTITKKNTNLSNQYDLLGGIFSEEEDDQYNSIQLRDKKSVMESIILIDYSGFSHLELMKIVNSLGDLQELSLVRCNVSLIGLSLILQKLSKYGNITKLVISGNDLSSINKPSQLSLSQQNIKQGDSSIFPFIKKQASFAKRVSLVTSIQRQLKSMVVLASQKDQMKQKNTSGNQDTLGKILEKVRETAGMAGGEEAFDYCISKLFSFSNLKYIDFSQNSLSEKQGRQILEKLQQKSELLMRYKIQQQSKKPKIENLLSTQSKERDILPSDQNLKQKSGFYQMFIEKQLASNIKTDNSYVRSNNHNSFTQFNTKFFTENQKEVSLTNQENPTSNQLKGINNDISSSSSSSSEEEENQQDNKQKQEQNGEKKDEEQDKQQEQKTKVSTILNMFNKLPKKDSILMSTLNLDEPKKNSLEQASENLKFFKHKNIFLGKAASSVVNVESIKSVEIKQKKKKIKKKDIEVPAIQELHFQNNDFSSETISQIAKHMAILHPTLKVLNLSPNKKIKIEVDTYNKLPSIQIMEINSNGSSNDSEDNDQVLPIEQQQQPKSQEFKESQQQSQYQQDSAEFDSLLLKSNSSIFFNEMVKIKINNISWKNISTTRSNLSSIFTLQSLTEIDLSSSITSNSAAELMIQSASTFLPCPLKRFSLNKSHGISKYTWKNIISCFLMKFTQLQYLSISDCQLNEERMNGILEALEELEMKIKLQDLILSGNPNLKGCLRQLILKLTQISQIRLQTLDFSSCQLTDECCEQMIQGLIEGRKSVQKVMNEEVKRINVHFKNNINEVLNQIEINSPISVEKETTEKRNIKSINFSLIKLPLYDNRISMKMMFLIQYCFVFQLTEQENILFSMQFFSNKEQKKQLQKILYSIKSNKELIYSDLYGKLPEEISVKATTLSLGPKVLATKKEAEDTIKSTLRTFSQIQNLNIFVNDKVIATLDQILTQNQKSKFLNILNDEQLKFNEITQNEVESCNESHFHQKDFSPQKKSNLEFFVLKPNKQGEFTNSPTKYKVHSLKPKSIHVDSSQQIPKLDNSLTSSDDLAYKIAEEKQKVDYVEEKQKVDDSNNLDNLEGTSFDTIPMPSTRRYFKQSNLFQNTSQNRIEEEEELEEESIKEKRSHKKNSAQQKQSGKKNVVSFDNAFLKENKVNSQSNSKKNIENTHLSSNKSSFHSRDSSISQQLSHTKNGELLIHLKKIETLSLSSNTNVGIINLLQFFSLISSDISTLDFSKLLLSHPMFIKLSLSIQSYFKNLIKVLFANTHMGKPNSQINSQTADAIYLLMTSKSIEQLSFINCSINEQIIELISSLISLNKSLPVSTRYLNLSQNDKISFQNEQTMNILDEVNVLILKNCCLNERKLNFNIQSWKQKHFLHLQKLDLSGNKGLSPMFFCYLGEFISYHKQLQCLNLSHTGMYEEKQKRFSYGLNRFKIEEIQLEILLIRQIAFSEKEGTLNLFKTIAQIENLKELDISEMIMNNYRELDLLHHYFKYSHIAKLTKILKLSFQNCTFLFEALPFYNFEARFSFSQSSHCSLFLLSQFNSLQELDLSGCLSSKRLSRKFIQELQVMRKNRLLNYSVTKLNFSGNFIPSEQMKALICNVLYIYKNLLSLNIRSNLRFEQEYATNLLQALDSFQYFVALQEYRITKKKNINENSNELKTIFQTLQDDRDITLTTLNNNNNIISYNTNNHSQTTVQDQYLFTQHSENYENKGLINKESYQNNLDETDKLFVDSMQEYQILPLEEFCFSDISSDLINHKEDIDTLLHISIINKIFQNLKKVIIYQDFSSNASSVRLQTAFCESLQELNETLGLEKQYQDLNHKINFCFKFKDSPAYINLKPVVEKIPKPFIRFGRQRQLVNNSKMDTKINDNDFNNNYQNNLFTFKGVRVEYIDNESEYQSDILDIFKNEERSLSCQINSNNDKYFLVNEWNEKIYYSTSIEQEEHQIQMWRKFEYFTKRIQLKQKIQKKTHINLNYNNQILKLLSKEYNIFIDFKHSFNPKIVNLLKNIDSIYLGNILYHFLVSVCQFHPKKDIIDFLIQYLIFLSTQQLSDLTFKNIRLPPFLILSEIDASKIQEAFVTMKSVSSKKRKKNILNFDLNENKEEQNYNQNSLQDQKTNGIIPDATAKKNLSLFNFSMINKSKLKLNHLKKASKIVCNYYYKSQKNCEEYIEIAKLKKMPPSTLDIENFSVNGLKAVYMICYENDYFIKGEIDYESLMFVSTSLAFSLREYFYKNYSSSSRNPLKAFLQRAMYFLMDIFVEIDNFFKYDQSLNALDEYFGRQTRILQLLKLQIIFYMLSIYVISPLFSFLKIGPIDKSYCSIISHFIFGFYCLLSFIFEILLLKKTIRFTKHLIPDLCLVHQQSIVSKIRDFFFEQFMNIETFSYKNILFFKQTIFSFLAKFDEYQDMTFIIICFNEKEVILGSIAVFIVVFNKLTEAFIFLKTMDKDSYSNLFLRNVNEVYEFSSQVSFEGLSNLLDEISPHNVLRITENMFTRLLLPKKAIGLTINKKIFNKVTKVIYCNLPQIIIQFIYSFSLLQSGSDSVQLSLALNSISILKSLLVILTIKQSVLNQMDFDELSEQKSVFLHSQFLQYQQKETEMFERINQNVKDMAWEKGSSSNSSNQVESMNQNVKNMTWEKSTNNNQDENNEKK